MALWIVFPVVAFALFGAVVWLSAFVTDQLKGGNATAETSEVGAWWRLMWPLFAGLLIIAFLAGWASQEPDPADEWVAIELYLLAALVDAMILRAFFRAFRSAVSSRRVLTPIATVGLFHCRAVVSHAFTCAASADVLAAALAHEAAHIRARDPLRIWLAQLAADLQWPIPNARRRFRNWALALEIRRDDEAVLGGASATALAESILLAAKLRSFPSSQPTAAITGQHNGLALRVRRLLADQTRKRPVSVRRLYWIRTSYFTAIAVAAAAGIAYGDSLLLLLPGVGR